MRRDHLTAWALALALTGTLAAQPAGDAPRALTKSSLSADPAQVTVRANGRQRLTVSVTNNDGADENFVVLAVPQAAAASVKFNEAEGRVLTAPSAEWRKLLKVVAGGSALSVGKDATVQLSSWGTGAPAVAAGTAVPETPTRSLALFLLRKPAFDKIKQGLDPADAAYRLDVDALARSASDFIRTEPTVAGGLLRVPVTLEADKFPGDTLDVKLVPDFARAGKAATAAALSKDAPQAVLTARVPADARERSFSLTVDGVPFAASYTFAASVEATDREVARIRLPAEVKRDKPVDILVEAGNVKDRLTLKLSDADGGTRTLAVFRRSRFESFTARLLPDGAVEFANTTRPHQYTLNPEGLQGTFTLTAYGADDFLLDTRTITLDDSKALVRLAIPGTVEDGDVRRRDLLRGDRLEVTATVADTESGIAAVYFYMGEAPDVTGKPAPASVVVAGRADRAGADDGPRVYSARLPVPALAGTVNVGVLAVNAVGVPAKDERPVVIQISDPKPPPAPVPEKPKRATGTITGKVTQGGLGQPDLDVILADAAGNAKSKGKTNSKGEFVYDEVAPGTYNVSAARAVAKTRGETTVEVKAADTQAVEVKLSR